jgi:hypothetical protein
MTTKQMGMPGKDIKEKNAKNRTPRKPPVLHKV